MGRKNPKRLGAAPTKLTRGPTRDDDRNENMAALLLLLLITHNHELLHLVYLNRVGPTAGLIFHCRLCSSKLPLTPARQSGDCRSSSSPLLVSLQLILFLFSTSL